MKYVKLIFVVGAVFVFFGCAGNEPQTPTTEKKEDTTIVMKTEVKKAPKVKVVERKVPKKKLKYRDTSESSQMRVYDPETKTLVKTEEEEDIAPTSEGGKLFVSKGCNLCHKQKLSRIGPSLRKLGRGYRGKEKELIAYLQRKGQPIINPDRGSIMRTQLAKLTILSEKEYNDLSQYILRGGRE